MIIKVNNKSKNISRIKSESKSESKSENMVYISERRSVCSENPARITNNRTPPPCFSPHFTTIQNHLILLHFKFCLANVHSCQYEQGTSAICFI